MSCPQCSLSLPVGAERCPFCGASVASGEDPLLGRTLLSQFTIVKKRGERSFGGVYEATQLAFRRQATVKTLHRHLTQSPGIAERFHREGLIGSQLEYLPAVVKIYNLGQTEEGILWFAEEHLEGETLAARLQTRGPLSPKELCEILLPIGEALTAAHEKGAFHRDLKPEDIVLAVYPAGRVIPKLVGLGLSALLEDTEPGVVIGAPPYMAPEQWRGLKAADARADIYALGVIAYQCLSGRLPFEADTTPGWMSKHCLEEPLDLGEAMRGRPLSPSLRSVVMKALAKDPSARYQTASALSEALVSAAASVERRAPPAPLAPPVPLAPPTPLAPPVPVQASPARTSPKKPEAPAAPATSQEEVLQAALEKNPNDAQALHKLMMLYYEAKRWPETVEIIERLAKLEQDKAKRAKFYYTIGVILRDEMKGSEQAVEYFNRALDEDYKNLKAFEKIDQILTAKKDWKSLERNYRKMLARLPPEADKALQIMLWRALGEIYRSRLGNLANAAEVFEMVSKLEPSNAAHHEILAELYAADPNQWQRAVGHHHKLLELKADRLESFQALYRIYMQSQQYDKAFCVAAALRFMNRAAPEEQGFHEQYRQKGLVRVKRAIDDNIWKNQIAAREENPYISAIFRLISPYVAQSYAQREKDLGLKAKERVDLAQSQLAFSKRLQYASQILKFAEPAFYVQQNRAGLDYELVLIDKLCRPAVVVGADLFSGGSEKELMFLIARSLAYLRPEYLLIRALKMSQATLKAILRAVMYMAVPRLPLPVGEEAITQQLVAKLASVISTSTIAYVKTIVEKATNEGNDFSIAAWMEHVEIAANRAGLILSNDLEVAGRMVQTDATPLSTLTVKDKVKELIRYSISEEYFQVREALGLTITG